MAVTKETESAKALQEILQDYETVTHSHFVLKYSDKKFFEDGMCNCLAPDDAVRCHAHHGLVRYLGYG